jgi:hypothetical protein
MYKEGYLVERYREDGERVELDKDEQYKLSKNQAQFCNDAEESGLDIVWGYSGRGMYGKLCPAVYIDRANDIATHARVREDSLGLGVVIYAQN